MNARSLCLMAAGWAVSAGSALAACQVTGPDPGAASSCGSFSTVHGLADTDVLLGQAAVTARLGAQRLGALADAPLLGRYPQDDASAAGDTAFGEQPARTIIEIVPPPVPEPEGVLAALAALATLGTLVARRRARDAARREGGHAAA